MAATLPFSPLPGLTTTGKTVKVTANNTPTSVPSTLTSTGGFAPSILVMNAGTAGAGTGPLIYVRISSEAVPVATAADVPIPVNTQRIFANPAPAGVAGLAVLSVTTTAGDVYFTPGQGGM